MDISERFKNKYAIVTGSADSIGKGVAARLGREGARLALWDINENMLMKTTRELQAMGIDVSPHTVDISKEEQVEKAMDTVIAKWGRVDVLVNAAGVVGLTSTPIVDYTAEAFDKTCAVNLRGSFLVTRAALRYMKISGNGRLLLIASIAGKEGNPGMVGYSASKAGVIGLVKGVAKEFATTNITINGLAPAVIRTTMNENTSSEQLSYMTSKIPMQRLGTVEEVSAMSCFIVSEENSFSTGFIYDISGGRATY